MDDTAQQLFLVGLLQVPSSSLAALVSLPSSPVYTTLAALLAADPDQTLRHLLHSVIARLAQSRNALPLPLLALYVHAFLRTNRTRVAAVTADAIAATPKLAQQLAATLADALRLALEAESESAGIVCSLVRAISTTGTVLTPQGIQDLVKTITQQYPPRRRRDDDHLRLALLEIVHDLILSCATNLGVDVLQPVLESLLLHKDTLDLAQDLATLYPSLADELGQLVLGAVGPVARSTKDLIARFRRSAADPQGADELDWVARLRREKEERQRAHEAGGAPDHHAGRDSAAKDRGKATAVAPPPLTAEREAELTKAVTSILDLFPSESPAFLRACLLHPRFSAGSSSSGQDFEHAQEQVVEALLSDGSSFPDELTRIRLGLVDGGGVASSDGAAATVPVAPPPPPAAAPAPVPATIERRNVYDDDKCFQRGKILFPTRGSADSTAPARTRPHRFVELDERLKQSILALAERESSDDEDDDEDEDEDDVDGEGKRARRRKTYGFLEEEEGVDDGTATPRIRIGGADEEPDENEQEAAVNGRDAGSRDRSLAQSRAATPRASPSASSSFTAGYDPSAVLLLESTYLRQPAVFARDAATRRGKARKELKERTGLGDEQIEGWRVMLERDPKKLQKMQDKHVDLGARSNRPTPPTGEPGAASTSSSRASRAAQDGAANSRAPGPSGNGGKGGGTKTGRSAQGQGQKSATGATGPKRSDGGRREHDRAKRGRDRKLARMGAAGAPP